MIWYWRARLPERKGDHCSVLVEFESDGYRVVTSRWALRTPRGVAKADVLTRFLAKVDKRIDDLCWPWRGPTWRGYGRFWLDGRTIGAHRASYLLHRGSIPSDLTIDHLCRNPGCVNPAHLEVVTQAENVRRGESPFARPDLYPREPRTHCLRGHPFTEENTIARQGTRRCRRCVNAGQRERRRQKAPGRKTHA